MFLINVYASGYVPDRKCTSVASQPIAAPRILVPGDDLAGSSAGATPGFPQKLSVKGRALFCRAPSLATVALALALIASPLPARGDDVEQGIAAAAAVASGPKPFVDTVCPLMREEADAKGLPAMFFVRLIWKESRFNPSAVSPKGAQGIAQFMPGTAADRGPRRSLRAESCHRTFGEPARRSQERVRQCRLGGGGVQRRRRAGACLARRPLEPAGGDHRLCVLRHRPRRRGMEAA